MTTAARTVLKALTSQELDRIHAYWRAANYLHTR